MIENGPFVGVPRDFGCSSHLNSDLLCAAHCVLDEGELNAYIRDLPSANDTLSCYGEGCGYQNVENEVENRRETELAFSVKGYGCHCFSGHGTVNAFDVDVAEDCRRQRVVASEVVIENGIVTGLLLDYHPGTVGCVRVSA